MPSFSLVGALEFKQVVASLQHEAAGTSLNAFETPITPYAGGHYHAFSHSRSRPRTTSREVDPWDAALGLPLDERSPHHALLPSDVTEEPEGPLDDARGSGDNTVIPSFGHTPATPTISDGDAESQVFTPQTRWERIKHAFGQVYHTLLPSLHNFKNKTFLGKIASILAAPAVMALTLTLPVVVTPYEGTKAHQEMPMGHAEGRLIDFEEEGIERALIAEEDVFEEMHEMRFNRWHMAAQCIFGPLFCAGVLFGESIPLLAQCPQRLT
jgi:solute carrier family 24 (sodium/potassium/calcium exchanger), member 6